MRAPPAIRVDRNSSAQSWCLDPSVVCVDSNGSAIAIDPPVNYLSGFAPEVKRPVSDAGSGRRDGTRPAARSRLMAIDAARASNLAPPGSLVQRFRDW